MRVFGVTGPFVQDNGVLRLSFDVGSLGVDDDGLVQGTVEEREILRGKKGVSFERVCRSERKERFSP